MDHSYNRNPIGVRVDTYGLMGRDFANGPGEKKIEFSL